MLTCIKYTITMRYYDVRISNIFTTITATHACVAVTVLQIAIYHGRIVAR